MKDYPGMTLPKLRNYFDDEIKQRLENHKTPYQTIIVAGEQRENFTDNQKAANFLGVSRTAVSNAKIHGWKCKGFTII